MATDSLNRSLLLAIIAFVMVLSPSPATAVFRTLPITKHPPSTLVRNVCKSAIIDPKICMSILASPEANSAKDAKSLALVVLEMAGKAAGATNVAINSMSKTPLGKHTPAFKICAEKFEQATKAFKKMIPQELEEDPMSASYDIKVNTDLADECDRAMADGKVVAPIITAGTRTLREFALLGFEVTKELE